MKFYSVGMDLVFYMKEMDIQEICENSFTGREYTDSGIQFMQPMPMATSIKVSRPLERSSEPTIRSKFPETWVWTDASCG